MNFIKKRTIMKRTKGCLIEEASTVDVLVRTKKPVKLKRTKSPEKEKKKQEKIRLSKIILQNTLCYHKPLQNWLEGQSIIVLMSYIHPSDRGCFERRMFELDY